MTRRMVTAPTLTSVRAILHRPRLSAHARFPAGLLEPIVVRHAPPQADQISFFNSSLIGPLTTTDQAGLSQGVDFLEWTLNNIT